MTRQELNMTNTLQAVILLGVKMLKLHSATAQHLPNANVEDRNLALSEEGQERLKKSQ